LISANANANSLTVLTNNGRGGFGLSASPSVGSNPTSVTAADVNGDGQTDLISANANANSLTVLTNYSLLNYLTSFSGNGAGLTNVTAASVAAANITGTVAMAQLAANSVDGSKVVDGSISNADIAASSVDSSKIVDGTIVNADINAAAAIADTKLATISTAGKIADSALSANVSLLGSSIETGEITDGTIVNADINAAAAIADTKLATISTAGKVADSALSANVSKLGAGIESVEITDGTIVNADISATAAIADTKLATLSTAGKVADSALSANVALLNGTNRFAGVVLATNVNNQFTGGFTGNGAGLTGVTANSVAAANITGTVSLAQLPPAVVTNGAIGISLSGNLAGAFSGNGAGLTNLNAATLTGGIAITSTPFQQVTNYTSAGTYTFTVPGRIGNMTVKLWGAGGGSDAFVFGGGGGYAAVSLPVLPGEQYTIVVGQRGASSAANLGGSGSNNGEGGDPGFLGDYNGRGEGGQASALFQFSGGKYIMKAVAGGGGGAGLTASGGAGGGGNGLVGGNAVPGSGGNNRIGGAGGGGGAAGSSYSANAITIGEVALNLMGGRGGNAQNWSGGGGGGYGGGGGGGGGTAGAGAGGGGGGSFGAITISGGIGTGQPGNTADPDYVSPGGRYSADGLAVISFDGISNSVPVAIQAINSNNQFAGSFSGDGAGLTNITDSALSANVTKLGASIESSEITDGTIMAADLAANSVGATQIAAGSVGATQIAAGAVNATHLAAGLQPALVPIGSVIDWWRPNGTFPVPTGYKICDGTAVADAGSPYNGQVVPNLNDKFVRGTSDPNSIGSTGGADTHAHTVSASGTTAAAGTHNHQWGSYYRSGSTKNWRTYNSAGSLITMYSTTADGIGGGSGQFPMRENNQGTDGTYNYYTTQAGNHTHTVTVSGSAASGNNVPAYVGLLKIMRIK